MDKPALTKGDINKEFRRATVEGLKKGLGCKIK
jgi:hypothetical protein